MIQTKRKNRNTGDSGSYILHERIGAAGPKVFTSMPLWGDAKERGKNREPDKGGNREGREQRKCK